jgi:hypothetical protein
LKNVKSNFQQIQKIILIKWNYTKGKRQTKKDNPHLDERQGIAGYTLKTRFRSLGGLVFGVGKEEFYG